jgi:hypothetical protein
VKDNADSMKKEDKKKKRNKIIGNILKIKQELILYNACIIYAKIIIVNFITSSEKYRKNLSILFLISVKKLNPYISL